MPITITLTENVQKGTTTFLIEGLDEATENEQRYAILINEVCNNPQDYIKTQGGNK